jgi:hypothetical protein
MSEKKLKPQVTIVYRDEADPDRIIALHRKQNENFEGKVGEGADLQLVYDLLEAVIADLQAHKAELGGYIEMRQSNVSNSN